MKYPDFGTQIGAEWNAEIMAQGSIVQYGNTQISTTGAWVLIVRDSGRYYVVFTHDKYWGVWDGGEVVKVGKVEGREIQWEGA